MAKKMEKKSLASLMGQRQIDPVEVEQAASAIHQKEEGALKVQEKAPVGPKPAKQEKIIRVSVDTPHGLYMKSKEAALDEDIKSLKDFYLHCVTAYLKSKGKI